MVEVNDDSHGTYNVNSQIKFKTSILSSNFCDYGNACILVSGTVIVAVLSAGGESNDIQVAYACGRTKDLVSEKKSLNVAI